MSAKSKTASRAAESMNAKLQLVCKSGKITLGYKSTLKALRSGKAKAILVSSNCLPLRRSEIEYYAFLTKTQLHHYPGNNNDLGNAMGKLFQCSVVSILDAGDSDFLTAMESA